MGIMNIANLGRASLKDKFFVDTNVWIYQAYYANKVIGNVLNHTEQQKLSDYSDFLQRIKQDGGELYTSPLCLSEIGHFIERQAYQYYKNKHAHIKLKDFRAIPTERQRILQDISQAWGDIQSLATILPFNVDANAGDHIITEMKSYPLDTYDALFFLTMKQHQIKNIISDDRDFQAIPQIDIYTA